MKVISSEKDYDIIAIGAEKILNETKVIPENVFRKALKFFSFITFDEMFMPLFFNHIKRYLLEVGEDSFWVTAIDPDPKIYFGCHFEFFAAIEFSILDTEHDYLVALNNYPKDNPADALAHNSNLLMVFSPTYKWAVYGNRETGIAICAFTDRGQMELFKSIYGSDLLAGVNEAGDYAYGAAGKSALKAKFCSSYPVD